MKMSSKKNFVVPQRIICRVCCGSFTSLTSLVQHEDSTGHGKLLPQRAMNENDLHYCGDCIRVFVTKSSLENHCFAMFHKPFFKNLIESEEKPGNSTSTSSSSFAREDQASEDGLKIKLKKTAKNLGVAATCFTKEDSEAEESEPRIFQHKKTVPFVLKRCLYRPCQSLAPKKRAQSRLNNIEGDLLKDVSGPSCLTTKLKNPEIRANFSPPLSNKIPDSLRNAECEISSNKGPGCDANSLAHIDSALDNVSQILDRSWPSLKDPADFPSCKSPDESRFKTTALVDFCPHCGDNLTNSASSLTINLVTNDATFVCRSCDLLIVMENCYRGIGCNSSFRLDVK